MSQRSPRDGARKVRSVSSPEAVPTRTLLVYADGRTHETRCHYGLYCMVSEPLPIVAKCTREGIESNMVPTSYGGARAPQRVRRFRLHLAMNAEGDEMLVGVEEPESARAR